MDFSRSSSSSSRGNRGGDKKPDIYSTVVIHGDGGSDQDDPDDLQLESYDDEEDSASLPPLLQRLPKDFGAAIDDDDDSDDEDADFSGTFVVKKDKGRPSPSARRSYRSPFHDLRPSSSRSRSDLDDVYSTFVVNRTVRSSAREQQQEQEQEEEEGSVSGTFVRTGSGGFGSSVMSQAVESMRASGNEGRQQQRQEHARRKASVSSVPESLTREDPSTKYELLHELGEL